jgi:hypothetical protein
VLMGVLTGCVASNRGKTQQSYTVQFEGTVLWQDTEVTTQVGGCRGC